MDTKICCKCKADKELEFFNKNKSKKDGYNSFCKECGKTQSRAYYKDNAPLMRKQIYANNMIRANDTKIKVYELLISTGCIDCGNKNPIVLEFDHRDPTTKKHNVAQMLCQGFSWKMVKEEIDKCDIRCANCHRVRTSIQQNWWMTKSPFVAE